MARRKHAELHCSSFPKVSIRMANKQFGVPKTTIQARFAEKAEPGKGPGHLKKFSVTQEKKLVDYACNRAALDISFGRSQFL